MMGAGPVSMEAQIMLRESSLVLMCCVALQWKEITPENLMDSKLKCVFEMPVEENAIQASGQETTSAPEDKAKRVGDSVSSLHPSHPFQRSCGLAVAAFKGIQVDISTSCEIPGTSFYKQDLC